MVCYFNLGFDAEVASKFEKVRSGNRFINNLYYTYYSLRGSICTCDLIRVNDFVESFTELKSTGDDDNKKHIKKEVFRMD